MTREVSSATQRLVLGDCVDILSKLDRNTIDVVVTSPPYNIGIKYNTFDDTTPRETYLKWVSSVAKQLHRVLSPNGSVFLNVAGSSKDPWVAIDVANIFRSYFVMQNNITWIKSISIGDDTVGHFKPINSKRFLNHNHEQIFHFTKSGSVTLDRLAVGVPYKDKSNLKRRQHTKDKRCAGDTWFIPYPTVNSKAQKFNHPASFPIELPKRCIKLHGKANAKVLDPFVGTGTTMLAAQQLNCAGLGIDIDQTYLDVARNRLLNQV